VTPTGERTFLVTARGKALVPNSLSNIFRAWCNEAGCPDVSAHGLRKACARRLADIGCTTHEIQAIAGHASLAEVERYTKAANRRRLAKSAMERLITSA
jgi:integrase